ncbi:MAG: type II toxin-antitoxin system PrlF family antitoxin [Calditrichia bacterium]|jgi:AbrB family looped-hinge helix DNA binding protein|nr:type II toxin-antitoxin system PrlF family antitoxin [Calditrichia bacterium]
MVSTLTSKGQLTIPKSIRKRFKLHRGDKIEFIIDREGAIRLVPVKSSVKELKGMVPPSNKKVSLEDMQNAIECEGKKI